MGMTNRLCNFALPHPGVRNSKRPLPGNLWGSSTLNECPELSIATREVWSCHWVRVLGRDLLHGNAIGSGEIVIRVGIIPITLYFVQLAALVPVGL